MKKLLEGLVKALVENASAVTVTETPTETMTIYTIKTAKTDTGKIIGKEGKMIGSIRNIFRAIATKEKKKILVEVKE